MNPNEVLASLRQHGPGSGERSSNYRGRGTPNRAPLSRVHQQPHYQSPRPSTQWPLTPDNSAAFYDLIRKNNLPQPTFTTINGADKKSKVPQFASKVTMGDRSWKTYPKTFPTADEAIKCAISIAYQDLCNGVGTLSVYPETEPISNEQLLQRVLEIVENEPTGMIDSAVVQEYINRHKSNLPKNWIQILYASGDKITLTQFDVHNKTVHTISMKSQSSGHPPMTSSQSVNGATEGLNAMSLSTNSSAIKPKEEIKPQEINVQETTIKVQKTTIKVQETTIKAPEPRMVKPSANGGLIGIPNGVEETKSNVKPDCESNGDMLATLAIIPASVPPPISINPAVDGSYFDVYVSLAANPSHFWVQPYDNVQNNGIFDLLMKEMKVFYDNAENRFEVHGSTIKKGVAFAVKQPNSYWYRIVVDSVDGTADSVQVAAFFVDCGDIRVLKVEELQPLYTQFQQLPRQAMKASLSNVEPLGNDWSVEATTKFTEIAEQKAFVSMVKGIKGSGTNILLKLQLTDTSDEEDRDVGKMLVDTKLAKFITEQAQIV